MVRVCRGCGQRWEPDGSRQQARRVYCERCRPQTWRYKRRGTESHLPMPGTEDRIEQLAALAAQRRPLFAPGRRVDRSESDE